MAKDKSNASASSATTTTEQIKGKISVNTHGTLFSKKDGYTGGDIIEAGTEVDVIGFDGDIGYTPVMYNDRVQWIDNDCIEIPEAE